MSKRNVYKGHRYVPKIMGEWNQEETYEGLSIVTNKGASYTSKKRVPVGIDILDEEYWVVTGNYNAQVENYRQEVREFDNRINDIQLENEKTIAQLAQKVTYKKYYLTEQGLLGDDTFRTISEVFPSVSLSEVQQLDPSATLNNSADWYVIQKLINELPNFSKIIVDGKFVLDLPLNVRRSHLTIEGKTDDRLSWSLKQIGDKQSLFKHRGSYFTIKNMLLTGVYDGVKKTKHGIEIYGDDGADSNQSDHMWLENCYIQNFGGNGIHVDNTHFILNTFKSSIIYNCYDNGIYMEHTATQQMNAMLFEEVSTYNNGLEYVNGQYRRVVNYDTSRGHGMNISGTGITIIGGDSSANASCGIFIHEGYYNEGMTIQGRYFEDNSLANLYSEGRKPINLVGNYMYPVLSNLGNMFFKYPEVNTTDDVSYELLRVARNVNKPVVSYTHTKNKEVHLTDINISTNEFIKNEHGLKKDDVLYPILNSNSGSIYASDVYPGGIAYAPESGYHVVEVTVNSFKVSLIKDGDPVLITSLGDVSKWHFEVNPEAITYVTNMYVSKPKKIKAKIKGRFLTSNSPVYILPVSAGVSANAGWLRSDRNFYSYPESNAKGDVYVDLEVRVDATTNLSVEIEGYGISTGANKTFNNHEINRKFLLFKDITGFDGLFFEQSYLANGTTVDIYLDE